jgi:cytidine deaminase
MPDEVDSANDQAEQILALQLKARKPVGPAPCGYCHYCLEEFTDPAKIFCDSDCANDFEKEAEMRRRNGKPD